MKRKLKNNSCNFYSYDWCDGFEGVGDIYKKMAKYGDIWGECDGWRDKDYKKNKWGDIYEEGGKGGVIVNPFTNEEVPVYCDEERKLLEDLRQIEDEIKEIEDWMYGEDNAEERARCEADIIRLSRLADEITNTLDNKRNGEWKEAEKKRQEKIKKAEARKKAKLKKAEEEKKKAEAERKRIEAERKQKQDEYKKMESMIPDEAKIDADDIFG